MHMLDEAKKKKKKEKKTHIIISSIKAQHIIWQLLQLVQEVRGNDNNVARVGSHDAEETMSELRVFANVSILQLFFFSLPRLYLLLFVARFTSSLASTSASEGETNLGISPKIKILCFG